MTTFLELIRYASLLPKQQHEYLTASEYNLARARQVKITECQPRARKVTSPCILVQNEWMAIGSQRAF